MRFIFAARHSRSSWIAKAWSLNQIAFLEEGREKNTLKRISSMFFKDTLWKSMTNRDDRWRKKGYVLAFSLYHFTTWGYYLYYWACSDNKRFNVALAPFFRRAIRSCSSSGDFAQSRRESFTHLCVYKQFRWIFSRKCTINVVPEFHYFYIIYNSSICVISINYFLYVYYNKEMWMFFSTSAAKCELCLTRNLNIPRRGCAIYVRNLFLY